MAGSNSRRGEIEKRRNEGNEIMLIPPRNIQALACCAGECLLSFCTWGNFNRRKWRNFNRRKLGNIQPALTPVDGPHCPQVQCTLRCWGTCRALEGPNGHASYPATSEAWSPCQIQSRPYWNTAQAVVRCRLRR